MYQVKLRFGSFLGILLLIAFIVGCNNAQQNSQESEASSPEEASAHFKTEVQDFDSSWNERIQVLDESIEKWDSSAQTYKGSLQDKMMDILEQVKEQRKELGKSVEQAGNQSKEQWDQFKSTVSDQYSDVIESIKSLSELNK